MKNRAKKNRTEVRGLRAKEDSYDVNRAEGLTQSSVLRPRHSKGFTLIELLIVVCIVAVMASMLFSRILFYQEMAEKAAMQQVVGTLQSAMVLQYGHRVALNVGPWVNEIGTANPMNWLSQKPGNYVGEIIAVNPDAVEPGNWAFDLGKHELVYVPKHTEYFLPANARLKWIRFRARLSYESSVGGNGGKVLAGLIFSPVESYQWIIREHE